jgi:hypothetical protein
VVEEVVALTVFLLVVRLTQHQEEQEVHPHLQQALVEAIGQEEEAVVWVLPLQAQRLQTDKLED